MTAKEVTCQLPKNYNSCTKRIEVSPCGKYLAIMGRMGEVHLLVANSNEVIYTFKQTNWSVDLCFTNDSLRLISNESAANVNIFNLRQRRLEHSFIDEGCIHGSTLALSPNQAMLATGSAEGVVNVYDFQKVQNSKLPAPEKSFMNLTTKITNLRFNHSSEMLVMSSRVVPNCIRLAHFPSGSVYANFPGIDAKIGFVTSLNFSPNSSFLAFGTKLKEVPLFRLKHFKNY